MYKDLKRDWMRQLTWNDLILFLKLHGKLKIYNMTVILKVNAASRWGKLAMKLKGKTEKPG